LVTPLHRTAMLFITYPNLNESEESLNENLRF